MSKILLVENDPEFLETIAESFKEEGFDVTTTGEKEKAIDLLKNNFDLIILDLSLTRIIHKI